MVYLRYNSELGMLLPSRLIAFPGAFRAEPEAVPGLEAARPACQCMSFILHSFYLHCQG